MNSCTFKRDHRDILCPFCCLRKKRKDNSLQTRKSLPNTKSAVAMILDFPASRTVTNKFLCFISYLVCGVLLLESSKSGDFLFMLLTSYPQSHLF